MGGFIAASPLLPTGWSRPSLHTPAVFFSHRFLLHLARIISLSSASLPNLLIDVLSFHPGNEPSPAASALCLLTICPRCSALCALVSGTFHLLSTTSLRVACGANQRGRLATSKTQASLPMLTLQETLPPHLPCLPPTCRGPQCFSCNMETSHPAVGHQYNHLHFHARPQML